MKLYTFCKSHDSEIKLENSAGCRREEYSYGEYLRFLEEAKRYHVHLYHYYYETDMSDSDEGSDTVDFSINYNNMIIKDNKLYGVLVKTFSYFPKYLVYPLAEESCFIELAGGYNSNSYNWTYVENDLSSVATLEASLRYVVIKETTFYEEGTGEMSHYFREIFNLTQKDFILDGDRITGVTADEREFSLSDVGSKITVGNHVYTLVRLDEEFLEKNILLVTYEDFKRGDYAKM